ncbi:hypothetical protein SRABI128_05819 [Microbacterium sp. Bi128]|nr:hypothetical protein SRABI128_05819 [Microbacterium sp. Bi128]
MGRFLRVRRRTGTAWRPGWRCCHGRQGAASRRRLEVEFGVAEVGPDVPELGQQGAAVDGALVRVPVRAPLDEFVDLRGQPGHLQRGRCDGGIDVLVGDLDGHVAFERLPARDHFVEHDPDGIDVAAGICLFAQDKFGGDVGDGPDQGARAGGRRDSACQAEVAELDPPVVGDQDVFGLDVPVDHSGGVRGAEAFDDRIDQRQGQPRRQGALVIEDIPQRVALDEFHDQIGEPAVLALVQDAHDVWVGEPGGSLGFAAQPIEELRVVSQMGMEHLQRDITLKALVRGEVHGGHPAAGKPGLNLVAVVHQVPYESIRHVFLHLTIVVAGQKRARINMRSGPVASRSAEREPVLESVDGRAAGFSRTAAGWP